MAISKSTSLVSRDARHVLNEVVRSSNVVFEARSQSCKGWRSSEEVVDKVA